jgi:hypothetical protein
MVFTKRLREGIRRGRIRCTVRIWQGQRVKVGGRYPMDGGHVVVDEISEIEMAGITDELARESGFDNADDLLGIAKHGSGKNVYLIRFHYLAPGAWDAAVPAETGGSESRSLLQRIRATTAPKAKRKPRPRRSPAKRG